MAGFDTHVHSTASDGVLTPAQLVARARELGLLGLAITDHDTVAGLDEARAAADDYPFIPGVELSSEYVDPAGQVRDVHILGYWLEPQLLMADGRLQRLNDSRRQRILQMTHRLELLGMPLDAEAILAQAGPSPGRPHVARAMVEAGYVTTLKEAFTKWLSRGLPAYVEREKLDPFTAVQMIRAARGVAALAHPGCGVPDSLIAPLVRAGIGGLEVYHPEHNPAAEKKYSRLASRYHLAQLGGSDFHTPELRELGDRVTTVGQLGKLAAFRQD